MPRLFVDCDGLTEGIAKDPPRSRRVGSLLSSVPEPLGS